MTSQKYQFLFLQLNVLTSLCRMMYVQSLTPDSSNSLLSVWIFLSSGKIWLQAAELEALFVT